jgi:hypothetical protein
MFELTLIGTIASLVLSYKISMFLDNRDILKHLVDDIAFKH